MHIAERSKRMVLSQEGPRGMGSNPTSAIYIFFCIGTENVKDAFWDHISKYGNFLRLGEGGSISFILLEVNKLIHVKWRVANAKRKDTL